MPRRASYKPGPKSRLRNTKGESSKKVRTFLGDASTGEESSAEDGSFHSAALDDQTDYGLEYTTSNAQSPRGRGRPTASPRSSTRLREQAPTASSPSRRTAPKKPDRTAERRRKQANPRQRERMYWRTVRQLQNRTDNLVPKAPFARVIREILNRVSTEADRLTFTALVAIQEAAEMYLTGLFQDAYCCTLHRGRVTLNVRDIELTRFLRGVSDSGNR